MIYKIQNFYYHYQSTEAVIKINITGIIKFTIVGMFFIFSKTKNIRMMNRDVNFIMTNIFFDRTW